MIPSMRTIGLLGGATWHSTATYYEHINHGVAARLGAFRSAELLLHSIDYGHIRASRQDGDFKRLGAHIVRACRGLQRAGAEGLFLCSNTLHKFAPRIESQVNIPLLHIADATAEHALQMGVETVGLLGTAYTLTQRFYIERLERHGLKVRIPGESEIQALDTILLEELAQGTILDPSRERFLGVMRTLQRDGADVIVLGCTEIGLLVRPNDVDLPLLDTAKIHAEAAVKWAIRP